MVVRRVWSASFSLGNLPKTDAIVAFKQHQSVRLRNLVDPASSHMLVSQIKPCMSKCKYFTVKLRMAHYNSYSLLGHSLTDIRGNPTVNTYRSSECCILLRTNGRACSVFDEHFYARIAYQCESPSEFLTHQVPTVRYWLTVPITGDEGLGFDLGEGAWEMATTSKEGSRRANYQSLTQGGSKQK